MPYNKAVKRALPIREQVHHIILILFILIMPFSFQSDLPSKKTKLQASPPIHLKEEEDIPLHSEEASNFKPFDYSSKKFSDIKKGNSEFTKYPAIYI